MIVKPHPGTDSDREGHDACLVVAAARRQPAHGGLQRLAGHLDQPLRAFGPSAADPAVRAGPPISVSLVLKGIEVAGAFCEQPHCGC